jgi:transcriptional regulator with XRE-family HTH domain
MRDEIWDKIANDNGFHNIKDLVDMWYAKRNMTQTEMAKKLGCSPATIGSLLFRFDIPVRTSTRKVGPTSFSRRELRDMSVRELAKKYKISKTQAWKIKLAQEASEEAEALRKGGPSPY